MRKKENYFTSNYGPLTNSLKCSMKFNLDQLSASVCVLFVRTLFACIDRSHLWRKNTTFDLLFRGHSNLSLSLLHSHADHFYIQLVICYDIFLPKRFNMCAISFLLPFLNTKKKMLWNKSIFDLIVYFLGNTMAYTGGHLPNAHALKVVWRRLNYIIGSIRFSFHLPRFCAKRRLKQATKTVKNTQLDTFNMNYW